MPIWLKLCLCQKVHNMHCHTLGYTQNIQMYMYMYMMTHVHVHEHDTACNMGSQHYM